MTQLEKRGPPRAAAIKIWAAYFMVVCCIAVALGLWQAENREREKTSVSPAYRLALPTLPVGILPRSDGTISLIYADEAVDLQFDAVDNSRMHRSPLDGPITSMLTYSSHVNAFLACVSQDVVQFEWNPESRAYSIVGSSLLGSCSNLMSFSSTGKEIAIVNGNTLFLFAALAKEKGAPRVVWAGGDESDITDRLLSGGWRTRHIGTEQLSLLDDQGESIVTIKEDSGIWSAILYAGLGQALILSWSGAYFVASTGDEPSFAGELRTSSAVTHATIVAGAPYVLLIDSVAGWLDCVGSDAPAFYGSMYLSSLPSRIHSLSATYDHSEKMVRLCVIDTKGNLQIYIFKVDQDAIHLR